ncbi:MAG: glycosyltransferase family 39 protein [Candidatus Moraniibacteriota bacterium]|nr:MAG: glycosyltransferase family 39 protein [Candidatus Moranbacteria bacterium]
MDEIRKFWKIFPVILFGLWTFGILIAYFYFYENYRIALLDGLFILLFLGLIFCIGAFFFFCIYLTFAIFKKPLPKFFSLFLYFKHKEIISISLKKIILSFFTVSLLWIVLIFLISKNFQIVVNNVVSLILIFFFVLLGFSLGSVLIRYFQIKTLGLLERYILASLFGFGILMFLMYVLGMIGLLYSRSVYIILFGILIFFRKEWFQLFDEMGTVHFQWKIRPFLSFKNFSFLALFILCSLTLTSLFSQFPIGFDELHTYQGFSHNYAENHRIVNFPYWLTNGFPQNGEMLFTFGHLLGGFQVSAGINVVFYFLLGGILVLFFRFLFVRSKEYYLLLLYSISSIPFWMLFDHKIDLIFWSYVMCGIYFLLKFIEQKKKELMILSFILLGISAGVKYNFFSLILPSILFVLIFFPREFAFKKRFFNSILCIFFVGLLFSPWALKNVLFSGNPIEPAFGDYLSRKDVFFKQIGRNYSDHLREQLADGFVWAENQDTRDWKFYATLPFRLTFNYEKENFSDTLNVGPIFLISFPFLFFLFQRKYKNIKIFLIFLLIFLQILFWIFFSNLLLFYSFIAFLLLFLILSDTLSKKNIFSLLFRISFFVLVFTIVPLRLTSFFYNETFFILENNGNYNLFEVAQFINEEKLPGLIWDSYGLSLNYYVQNAHSRIIYDFYMLLFYFLCQRYEGDVIVDFMKSHNVYYFIYKENSIKYWQNVSRRAEKVSPFSSKLYLQSFEGYLGFREKHLKEIFRSGDIGLYTYKD